MKENTPKNCTECQHKKYCWGYYGGLTCKHKEEIASEYNQKISQKNEKKL